MSTLSKKITVNPEKLAFPINVDLLKWVEMVVRKKKNYMLNHKFNMNNSGEHYDPKKGEYTNSFDGYIFENRVSEILDYFEDRSVYVMLKCLHQYGNQGLDEFKKAFQTSLNNLMTDCFRKFFAPENSEPGRPKKSLNKFQTITAMIMLYETDNTGQKKYTQAQIAKELGVSRQTLFNMLKQIHDDIATRNAKIIVDRSQKEGIPRTQVAEELGIDTKELAKRVISGYNARV